MFCGWNEDSRDAKDYTLTILDINTYNVLEHSPFTVSFYESFWPLCVRANVREEHKYLYIKSACSWMRPFHLPPTFTAVDFFFRAYPCCWIRVTERAELFLYHFFCFFTIWTLNFYLITIFTSCILPEYRCNLHRSFWKIGHILQRQLSIYPAFYPINIGTFPVCPVDIDVSPFTWIY